MSMKPKTCGNCAHRKSDRCGASGYFVEVQRKYPSNACDKDFSGWLARESLLTRFKNWLYK